LIILKVYLYLSLIRDKYTTFVRRPEKINENGNAKCGPVIMGPVELLRNSQMFLRVVSWWLERKIGYLGTEEEENLARAPRGTLGLASKHTFRRDGYFRYDSTKTRTQN